MGQLALGFKNLLIKAAVFVVMAALLAWALGGTLWPRTETADLPAVRHGGATWFWRAAIGGRRPGELRWLLVRRPDGDVETEEILLDLASARIAGPIAAADGVWIARQEGAGWRLERYDAGAVAEAEDLADRLAVERRLAEIAAP